MPLNFETESYNFFKTSQFELAYLKATVYHISHYVTGTLRF